MAEDVLVSIFSVSHVQLGIGLLISDVMANSSSKVVSIISSQIFLQ